MIDQVKQLLINLCVDIYAHSTLDWEIDLGGNGTNSSEAVNVAEEILLILGVKYNDLKEKIDDRMEELKNE